MDLLRGALEIFRDLVSDLVAEIVVAVVACGLLALGWWGFRVAPYLTLSIALGVLLYAGYGLAVYLRETRGAKLAARLGGGGILTAAVVVILATYLPSCDCVG
ncbi:hypothetical protein AB0J74_29380 [Asanoa sp. NPDC049573]|uniref:hypothetical protein n=1 Tax=Asanoa sp. NPDC049573 TaxID=3155396 RepID=UPI00343EAAC5